MSSNPVESNALTRTILGFAVIIAMAVAGGIVGRLFVALEVPYGAWLGVGVGAVLVFAGFVVAYRRYDATTQSASNPLEANVVTRTILGFAVIAAMMLAGGGLAEVFVTLAIPYGAWLGVAIGAVLVFAAFVIGYRRYDARFTS